MTVAALVIRGLDEVAAARLKDEARRRGLSVNAVLKLLVREGLGLVRPDRTRRHSDLDSLAGSWSADEARDFLCAVEPFERVDEELWR
ncbi:MAG: antitoxin [Acidobacteriota bacterium]